MFGGGRVRFIRTGETKQRARRAARGSAKEKIVAKLESILSDKSRIGARSPFDRIPRPTEITFSDENGVARKGKGGERERDRSPFPRSNLATIDYLERYSSTR